MASTINIEVSSNDFATVENIRSLSQKIKTGLARTNSLLIFHMRYQSSFAFDIKGDDLFDDALDVFLEFHHICTTLPRKPSVSVLYGSCDEVMFDFALCCQFKVIANESFQIQFRSPLLGHFPWFGGILNHLKVFNKRNLERRDVFSASLLRKLDIMNLWVKDWSEYYIPKLKNIDVNFSNTSRMDLFSLVENKAEIRELKFHENLWNSGWKISNSTKLSTQSKSAAIVFLAAKYYFHKKSLSRSLGVFDRYPIHNLTSSPCENVLYFDNCIPSLDMIKKEYSGKFVLYFSDDKRLLENLNLIASRLEYPDGKKIWKNKIHWTSKLPSNGVKIIRHEAPNLIHLIEGHKQLTFKSLNGWLESDCVDVSLPVKGHLFTKKIAQTYLSECIIGLFFEELMRVSKRLNGGMTTVLTALENRGWSRVYEDNFWDFFLRNKVDYSEELKIGHVKCEKKYWEINVWKDAKRTVKASKHAQADWDEEFLSAHFSLYCGVLADFIAKAELTDSVKTADILVAESIGFPLRYGIPSLATSSGGDLKINMYKKRYWPWLL